MKVLVQTSLTPVLTVYDSSAPSSGGIDFKKILKPVVQVADDNGNVIYSNGDFYTPWLFYGLIILAGAFIVRKLL